MLSRGLEGGTGGARFCSDEIFLAAAAGVLEGRVVLQGGICALGELRALGLVGVVGALVPVHVVQREKEEAQQHEGHSGDNACAGRRVGVSRL